MKKKLLFVLLIIMCIKSYAIDEIFGYMRPGGYKVGLNVIQIYDHSRTFGPKVIENGVPRNNARPIQILVWYPATGGGEKISYKDYIALGFTEVDFTPLSDEQKDKFIEMHKRNFLRNGSNSENMNAIISRESYAIKDNQPVNGKFPLVIYSPGGNERCYENFILAEYLASHGYIVAAIALTGEDSQLMAFEPSDYETSVDDISFLISYMQSFPNVDNSKLALAGFCWGGMVNAIVANRNSNVDAIIDLFGALNDKGTRSKVEAYRYHNLKNPNLAYLQLAGSALERDSYFMENYLYGDVYQVRFYNVSHGAFTSNYVARNHYFKGQLPNGKNESYSDTVDACYKNLCRLTLEMLNGYLLNSSAAIQFLNNAPTINGMSNLQIYKRIANPNPPTPAQFIQIAKNEGIQKIKQIYSDVRNKDKYWKLFKENQMIALGYQLFGNGNIDDAIEVFSMIIQDYPNSWNAYDSLGEAWLKKGDKEKAKLNLVKSIELLPENKHAKELLKQI